MTKRKNYKHLFVPLLILFAVVGCTAGTIIQQSGVEENYVNILSFLVKIIAIIGSGLIALIVYVFKRLSDKVDKIGSVVASINIRCANFGHMIDERSNNDISI